MKKSIIILVFLVSILNSSTIYAQDPYIGEIRLVAFNFAPQGWALCNGQILPISQNQALFSLLGTIYGGNGITTFALPDLRGRAPIHAGQGPGLSNYSLGQIGGTETNIMTVAQMPRHSHAVNAVTTDGNIGVPTGALPANTKTLDPEYSSAVANTVMSSTMIADNGANQPMNNIQPYITINYIIALQGVYPPRQ